MTQTPDLVGSVEGASIVRTSTRTFYRLVEAGEITPALVAPGGQYGTYLFNRQDLEAYRDAQADTAPAQ